MRSAANKARSILSDQWRGIGYSIEREHGRTSSAVFDPVGAVRRVRRG